MGRASTPQTLPAGYKLHRYTIRKTLGHGATGAVYLATADGMPGYFMVEEHLPYGILRRVRGTAELRVVDTTPAGMENARKLEHIFRTWARCIQTLDHPDIPPVQEVFRAQGTAYCVTPYVEGPTLEEWAAANPTPSRKSIISLLFSLLGTLGYMHGRAQLHGDLHPVHIVLRVRDNHPVPTRFGMARLAIGRAVNATFTPTGYIPYELLQNRGNIGAWSDLYSLGAIMYRLITGTPPVDFRNRTNPQADPYAPLAADAARVAKYGEPLLASIDKALRVPPAMRWQNAAEWYKALADIPAPTESESTREPAPASGKDAKVKRNRVILWSISALLLAGVCVGGYCLFHGKGGDAAPLLTAAQKAEAAEQLLKAAKAGNTDEVRSLLERGADINAKDKNGESPLHWAVGSGHVETAKLLLERGANVNYKDSFVRTPLHLAALNGKTETAELLLDRGADVNAKDNDGSTPLCGAAEKGRTETARLLLERGADINAKDKGGKTPLHWAADESLTETARLLLEHGADANAKDNDGKTPLHWTAAKCLTETARLLLEYGADVNVQANDDWTPLHWAAFNGKTETAALLLEHGADAGIQDDKGMTPLERAIANGRKETAKLLADATSKDNQGQTPSPPPGAENGAEPASGLQAEAPSSQSPSLSEAEKAELGGTAAQSGEGRGNR